MYRLARGQIQDSSPPLKHELEAVVTKAGDEPGDEARSVSSPPQVNNTNTWSWQLLLDVSIL